MNDEELQQLDSALTRLAAGDRSAFEQAFALVSPALSQFVGKAMAGHPEREDAVQNTLVRVFGRVSDYRPGTNALAWVLTLAAFEVATLRKRTSRDSGRYGGGSEALAVLSALDDIENAALEREAVQRLGAVVRQLDPGDQRVLLSPDVGPKAPRERKRKQRALDRLKSLWRTLNGND